MNREEWLAARRKGLGGSDSPIVLGVNPWESPVDLWLDKRGLKEAQEPNAAMKRGTALEPLVADMYEETSGRQLKPIKQILQHPEHDWMLANPDREILNATAPGILEIKCPGLNQFGKIQREGLPDYYQVQLQHYLAVTDLKWGAIAAFNAERWELIFFDVDRDDELINTIIVKDAEFWQLVKTGKEPAVEIEPTVVLPKTEPTELMTIDSPEWRYAVERLRDAREVEAEAKALHAEAKERVQGLMADRNADVAEGAGCRVYWRMVSGRSSVDTKKLKSQYPDIWKEVQKQGKDYRKFTPYFLKGGGE